MLGRDKGLGIRLVVDQADFGEPVEHFGGDIVGYTP
jgi:hypothetical protein